MSRERPDPVVAKRLLICDRIERRTDGSVNLINLWLLKRLPPGWTPASVLPPWAAFAWLTNGRGTLRFWLDVVAQQKNGQQIRVWQSTEEQVSFFDPLETHLLCVSIGGLRIRASGVFTAELYCEDEWSNRYFIDATSVVIVELMKKKKPARKIDPPILKDNTPSPRPPDRPRIFLTKPLPPPKIVWIEGGTSLLDDPPPPSSSKSRRNGRR